MNDTSLTFRITLWRPWLIAVTPLALLAAVGLAFSAANGKLVTAVSLLIVLVGIAVILLVPIGLAVRVSRWNVDPNGIGGPNNRLVYHRLAWSDIESVTPWLIPGYPYVQVNGGGKRRVFWLPLFLTNMPRFRSAVARYAPPDNPLRHYLEQHPVEPGVPA
jgi:hypothetical protein